MRDMTVPFSRKMPPARALAREASSRPTRDRMRAIWCRSLTRPSWASDGLIERMSGGIRQGQVIPCRRGSKASFPCPRPRADWPMACFEFPANFADAHSAAKIASSACSVILRSTAPYRSKFVHAAQYELHDSYVATPMRRTTKGFVPRWMAGNRSISGGKGDRGHIRVESAGA